MTGRSSPPPLRCDRGSELPSHHHARPESDESVPMVEGRGASARRSLRLSLCVAQKAIAGPADAVYCAVALGTMWACDRVGHLLDPSDSEMYTAFRVKGFYPREETRAEDEYGPQGQLRSVSPHRCSRGPAQPLTRPQFQGAAHGEVLGSHPRASQSSPAGGWQAASTTRWILYH